MKLYLKCTACNYENHFKCDAETRIEYAMKYGKYKQHSCTQCSNANRVAVNNMYAKESKWIYLIAGSIFLMGSLAGLYFYIDIFNQTRSVFGLYASGLILLIPVFIYNTMNKEDRVRVRTFNQTYVREDINKF